MNRYFQLILFILGTTRLLAQSDGIGIGTTQVADDAILEIESTNKGILIPRRAGTLTPTNPSEASGLLIYNTTDDAVWRYDGGWARLIHTGSAANVSSVTATGNISGTNITASSSLTGQNATINGTISTQILNASNDVTATDDISAGDDITAGGEFIGNGIIPVGGIIMWSGDETDIPDGWELCDGGAGTPNLVDRFIMGGNSRVSGGSRRIRVVNSTADYSPTASGCSDQRYIVSSGYVCQIDTTYTERSFTNIVANGCYEAAAIDGPDCESIPAVFNCNLSDNPDYYENNPNCRVAARYYQLAFIMRIE